MNLSLDIALPDETVRAGRARAVARDFQLAGRRAPFRLLEPTQVSLAAGQLVYLVGASGAGKSQVLRQLADRWPGPVLVATIGQPTRVRHPDQPVLDALRLPVDATLDLLCLAGLGEPRLWLLPPRCLSAGQADRLALASLYAIAQRRLARDGRDLLLLIDEFGSRLDRLTASILSANLRRWLTRTPRLAVVVATAHDDLADALAADAIWVKTLDGTLHVTRPCRE